MLEPEQSRLVKQVIKWDGSGCSATGQHFNAERGNLSARKRRPNTALTLSAHWHPPGVSVSWEIETHSRPPHTHTHCMAAIFYVCHSLLRVASTLVMDSCAFQKQSADKREYLGCTCTVSRELPLEFVTPVSR